jgi:hypothetical protein
MSISAKPPRANAKQPVKKAPAKRRHADRMDDLLDLTSRVEATHFWFRGFRRFVAPAVHGSRRAPRPSAARLRLRHRPQPGLHYSIPTAARSASI